MGDLDRALSFKLFDVMKKLGVSEKIRKLYKYKTMIFEVLCIIHTMVYELPATNFIFGSFCEGTTSQGLNSDVDVVKCDDKYSAITDIRSAPLGVSYLMVRDDRTYPGYVKLQLVRDGTPMTIFNSEIPDEHNTDAEGRICKIHSRTFHLYAEQYRERHGPADAYPANYREHLRQTDKVYALRCTTIPCYAREWLDRLKLKNWPTGESLRKMGDLGCFVVGVGHVYSREQHIEWRLSFSLQERILMFSLNPTQHKCYVLLKMIKKDIVQTEIGECITSYHCKTCILRAIEVTKAEIWRPINLVCCVRLCLVILLTWVVNGVCPNYFISSENMFEKPQLRVKKARLVVLLQRLIADGNSFILRLHCDGIGNRMLHSDIQNNDIPEMIVYREYLRIFNIVNTFCNILYMLASKNPVICQFITTMSTFMERLYNTRFLAYYNEKQTVHAISYVIPVFHLHIGQRLASLVCTGQCQEHERQLLDLSFYHLKHGNNVDLTTSRLIIVSLLIRLEKYDLSDTILEGIENELKSHVGTKCTCYFGINTVNEDLLQHIRTNAISCKTAFKSVFVGCVRFIRCDINLTPAPLQYEMYRSVGAPPESRHAIRDSWFDWAVVDGKIYFYFLQYLVNSRLNRQAKKQVAIHNLRWVLIADFNLRHTETAYNLLGWIYIQERRIPEAVNCFVASWRIRPDHNAAKFHVLKLAQDMMCAQR